MTIMRISYWLLSICLALSAVGCASSPSRFYILASAAKAGGEEAVPRAILVGPVSVPAAVDRSEFVVQVAPNRVEIDEFNRWAAPLPDGITRAVVGDLAVLLATPDVAAAPLANFDPAYRVTIDVQQFDSIRGQGAQLDAVWAVRSVASDSTRAGRTDVSETVADESYEELAAAHSRALARLSSDIAAAIRAAVAAEGEAAAGKSPAAKKATRAVSR